MITFETGLYEDPGEADIDDLLTEEGYEFNEEFTEAIAIPEGDTQLVYDQEGEETLLRASYVDNPDPESHPEFEALVSVDAYSGRNQSDIDTARDTAHTVATEFGGAFLNPQDGTRLEASELE